MDQIFLKAVAFNVSLFLVLQAVAVAVFFLVDRLTSDSREDRRVRESVDALLGRRDDIR